MIWERLDTGLMKLGVDAKGQEDVLRLLGDLLTEEGFCKDSFADALVAREKGSPTGVDMSGFGVAIPHTDVSHVLKDATAIAVLKRPVAFTAMGTDDEAVQVRLVFVLAITNPAAHLDHIQALLGALQDRKVLERISGARSAEEIIKTIKDKETMQ
jgi:PTS system galactitol-specific IIA component